MGNHTARKFLISLLIITTLTAGSFVSAQVITDIPAAAQSPDINAAFQSLLQTLNRPDPLTTLKSNNQLTPRKPTALDLGDPENLVCSALESVGIRCLGTTRTPARTTPQIKEGSLVRVQGTDQIFQIVDGKRHFIPTREIFIDYGFKDSQVIEVSLEELDRFPRVKLMRPKGIRKKVYYVTEIGYKRLMPNNDIMYSYGTTKEDIIVVSDKELSFYPDVQYVFVENPFNQDVFKIKNNTKYFVTPKAMTRMNINRNEIAPINQTEFDYYKYGRPITE